MEPPPPFRLVFTQHKGQTRLEWQIPHLLPNDTGETA